MFLEPAWKIDKHQIEREWNDIALTRLKQIQSGQDISYKYVLSPLILNLLRECDLSKVVDLGCGTGTLTAMIAKNADYIVGVDISHNNIELARQHSTGIANLNFVNIEIEKFTSLVSEATFTTAVAGMTLMTVLQLDEVLQTINSILKPKGHFIFTITHPCYWPIYWGYYKEKWYNYQKEIPIKADFRISLNQVDGCITTHIHRPLGMYFNSLAKAGFHIVKIVEPFPSSNIEKLYPNKWEFPRFLGVHCVLK